LPERKCSYLSKVDRKKRKEKVRGGGESRDSKKGRAARWGGRRFFAKKGGKNYKKGNLPGKRNRAKKEKGIGGRGGYFGPLYRTEKKRFIDQKRKSARKGGSAEPRGGIYKRTKKCKSQKWVLEVSWKKDGKLG